MSKYIAFTFDDGPNNEVTPKVLDLFEQYGGAATFFVCGNRVDESVRVIMARALKLGCEYGNHSYTHARLSGLTADEISAEISKTQAAVQQIAGVTPILFRPPCIDVSDRVYETVKMPFIRGYSSEDWNHEVTVEQRIERVLNNARDGLIVLMHDFVSNDATPQALETILPELKRQGYEFVTVSELFRVAGRPLTPRNHLIDGTFEGAY